MLPFPVISRNGLRTSTIFAKFGAYKYDVHTEGMGVKKTPPNLQTNNIDFADKEGRGGKRILNLSFDVIYGSG